MAGARRKQRAPARQGALAASIVVHIAIAAFLIASQPREPLERESHPISVDLTSPWQRPKPATRQPSTKPAAAVTSSERPAPTKAETAQSPTAAEPAVSSPQPVGPTIDEARLGAALRRSGVGCANADLVRLSEAEREACRHRLADGAANAPYVSGIPPVKAEYYAALAKSEADMKADPLGGHGPDPVCGRRAKKEMGLKIGPCKLTLPMTPWTPETDVRPP